MRLTVTSHMKFRFVIVPVLIILFFSMTGFFSLGQTSDVVEKEDFGEKHVLYISSYSPSFRTFFQQVDGLRDAFTEYSIVLDVEFMDTKRFFTEENIENFSESLEYKLNSGLSYDLIIVGDDNGANLVMEHRAEWFGEIPIIFLGVNNYENAMSYSGHPDVTGVFEAPSFADTIEMGLSLNPDADRIVGLVDKTPSGQGDKQLFLDTAEAFPDKTFVTVDLSDMTFGTFKNELTSLDAGDVVVLISVFRDMEETTVTFDEGVDLILDYINVPVYHPYQHGIGDGLLGGRTVSHYDQGMTAGKMALDYFLGMDFSDIELVDESPNAYIADYTVIRAYGYDKNALPDSTELLNYEPTFFEQYLALSLGVLFIILFEASIIFALVYMVGRKRRAEKMVLESKLALQESHDELEITNEELFTTIDNLKDTNAQLEESLAEVEERDARIHELIYIDSLTGLFNRFAIYESIDQLLLEGYTNRLAIIFLDVDNFKNINDIFGHDVGDRIIRDTGNKLQDLIDDQIKIGRFGGDEFIFTITKAWTTDQVIRFAERIRDLFKNMINFEDNKFILTVSLGIAIYPQHGRTKEELIKKADIALYEAKSKGKDTYVIFDKTMDDELAEKVSFQHMLADAYKNNEFMVYYQPLYGTDGEDIFGYEALIRWYSTELGWVSPYKMITVAEEVGSIIEIGEFVFRQATRFAVKVNRGREKRICISINISAVQLMFNEFFDMIMGIIKEEGATPEILCLEMTETVFIKNLNEGKEIIQKLVDAGFTIALDDFGTGYSSLGYLKNFNIDVLKIDQSFVRFMEKDNYDRFLVKAIIEIAKKKKTLVIAEGVETLDQFEILKQMQCDVFQGFYFNRPMPEGDALGLLEK